MLENNKLIVDELGELLESTSGEILLPGSCLETNPSLLLRKIQKFCKENICNDEKDVWEIYMNLSTMVSRMHEITKIPVKSHDVYNNGYEREKHIELCHLLQRTFELELAMDYMDEIWQMQMIRYSESLMEQ